MHSRICSSHLVNFPQYLNLDFNNTALSTINFVGRFVRIDRVYNSNFSLSRSRHELNSHQATFDIRTLQGHGDDEYTVTRDEMLKVEASYNQMSREKEDLHTDYIELQAKLEELLAENERLRKELETQKKTNQLKTAKHEAQVCDSGWD